MGEDPGSIHVVGAPGLDAAFRTDLPDRAALEASLGLALTPPVVIVTVHPATLDADPASAARAVVAAMDLVPATYVVTLPNADPGAATVRDLLLVARRRRSAGRGRGARRGPLLGPAPGRRRDARQLLERAGRGPGRRPACGQRRRSPGGPAIARRNVLDATADATAVADALREP